MTNVFSFLITPTQLLGVLEHGQVSCVSCRERGRPELHSFPALDALLKDFDILAF